MSRRLLVPAAVAVLVAAATATASISWPVLPPPREGAGAGRRVPVVARTLVCPDVTGVPGRSVTRATVASVPGTGGAGTAGTAGMAGLGGSFPAPLPLLAGPAGVAARDVAVAGGPVRLEARGLIAAGVGAEQLTRTDGGPDRGLAETRCAAPASDMWFVGGSTAVGAAATLLLVNPDDVPATADVGLLTPTGPVSPRSAQGIEVPPRGSVRLGLETLAPAAAVLATSVTVRAGRLTAVVRDGRRQAELPLGVDYLPQAGLPARKLFVPGLPPGPGPRRLLLAVPGSEDATVELRLVTSESSFVPAALHAVRVPARTVVPVELTAVLAGKPAGVAVSSDVPVLAGGFTGEVDSGTGIADLAWTGPTPPLGGAALLPDNRVGSGVDSMLLLSAPDASASVTVTALPAASSPAAGPFRVVVPGGQTVTVSLHRLAVPSGSYALVVTPVAGSGPVYGARLLRERGTRGPLLSVLALEGTEASVQVPEVVLDAGAGVAGPR